MLTGLLLSYDCEPTVLGLAPCWCDGDMPSSDGGCVVLQSFCDSESVYS